MTTDEHNPTKEVAMNMEEGIGGLQSLVNEDEGSQ